MRFAAQLAALVATLASIAWLIYTPGFDSAVASAAALAALLSTFFLKRDKDGPLQKQSVSGNSVGVQAGGDVKIHNFKQ